MARSGPGMGSGHHASASESALMSIVMSGSMGCVGSTRLIYFRRFTLFPFPRIVLL